VRRSEFGNNTRTTSPRRVFIVDRSRGAVPVFGEGLQSGAKVGGLKFINATRREINRAIGCLLHSQHGSKLDFKRLDPCLELKRPLPLAFAQSRYSIVEVSPTHVVKTSRLARNCHPENGSFQVTSSLPTWSC